MKMHGFKEQGLAQHLAETICGIYIHREFTTSDRYTGFTKSGTRIPAESVSEFKQIIEGIKEDDFPAATPDLKDPEEPESSQEETVL